MSDEEDLIIEILVWEDDREAHVARHGVTIDEVLDVMTSTYAYATGKYGRPLLIGKTGQGRFLTIVIAKRDQARTYGLVTTRPSRDKEKKLFEDLMRQQGGEDNDHD